MSTKFLSPGWRMPRNANQSKQASYSLHFTPGSVTNVNLGDALSFFIGSFSASMWVKSPDNGKEFFSRYISANGVGNFRIGCGANSGATANTVSLMTKNFLLSGSTDIRDGNWHHVCVTMDAISSTQYTRTIYVDGSQDAQDTVTLATYVSTSSSYGLNLGCNFQNNGHTSVDMSEVSIFNYALSASQVTTLWGGGTSVSNPMALPSPPIAYYLLGTSAWNGQYLAENNAIGDYVFDFPSGDYVNLSSPSSLQITGSLTLSSWVKYTSGSGGNKMIISKADGTNQSYFLSLLGNHMRFSIFTGNSGDSPDYFEIYADQEPELVQDTWYHIVGVFESGVELRAYINGVPVIDTDIPKSTSRTAINVNNTDVTIGMFSNGTQYPFLGEISNSQIWDTALTNAEVATLYNYGSPIQTLANIPQNSNLKAWYKLDASEVYNSSTTEWSVDNNQNPSAYPSSLDFVSSESDYIDCGNNSSFDITSELTLSAWIKKSSTTSNQFYISKRSSSGDGYQISSFSNKAAGMSIWIGGSRKDLLGTTNHVQDVWYHVVGTYDGANMRVYLNGIEENSVAQTGAIDTTTAKLILGAYDGSGYSFDGKISNAQIFNTALPEIGSNSVETLYNNGTPLSDMSSFTSLVSWYKLNNTTTGIQDSKGSNNGTNNGATEYTGFVNKLVGDSSGMSQANLVQSDLQTVAPYSKYAIKFEAAGGNERIEGIGDTLGNGFSELSISAWVKYSSSPGNQYWPIIAKSSGNGTSFSIQNMRSGGSSNGGELYFNVQTQNGSFSTFSGVIPSTNVWYNVVGTYNGSEVKIYINNSLKGTLPATGIINTNNSQVWIGDSGYGGYSSMFQGVMSNISVWNTGLTSSQVTEIYNQGLPSNLNSHSAYSNLVSWWQLGGNSSFDGNDWLFADEKGSNNGESINMTISDLVNGVGTTANGVSSGMSEGSLVGDAPYSTANALSSGMAVTARGTDVP